ncbi:hypothetical protein Bbelb_183420 [Branchiostoma belcheri]|nr:hypothetical protein Bbelb_183420 [Branchiostoma belcheri]
MSAMSPAILPLTLACHMQTLHRPEIGSQKILIELFLQQEGEVQLENVQQDGGVDRTVKACQHSGCQKDPDRHAGYVTVYTGLQANINTELHKGGSSYYIVSYRGNQVTTHSLPGDNPVGVMNSHLPISAEHTHNLTPSPSTLLDKVINTAHPDSFGDLEELDKVDDDWETSGMTSISFQQAGVAERSAFRRNGRSHGNRLGDFPLNTTSWIKDGLR